MDYLKNKLDTVDQSLFDLDDNLKHSDKDSMDLKTTKNALDHHKVSSAVCSTISWHQLFRAHGSGLIQNSSKKLRGHL